jgi:hypothetical protein
MNTRFESWQDHYARASILAAPIDLGARKVSRCSCTRLPEIGPIPEIPGASVNLVDDNSRRFALPKEGEHARKYWPAAGRNVVQVLGGQAGRELGGHHPTDWGVWGVSSHPRTFRCPRLTSLTK